MRAEPIIRLLKSNRLTSIAFLVFYQFYKKGFWRQSGWLKSYLTDRPIDREGNALPWYTYAAIDCLGKRVNNAMTVFEMGAGYSTIWWSNHVKSVVSIEHDQAFLDTLKETLKQKGQSSKVELHCLPDVPQYVAAIKNYSNAFDLIIVDGITDERVAFSKNILSALKVDGVIIWDNSDRVEKFKEGFEYLTDNGFKRLDFVGIGPINLWPWSTSIFYRQNNCLGM